MKHTKGHPASKKKRADSPKKTVSSPNGTTTPDKEISTVPPYMAVAPDGESSDANGTAPGSEKEAPGVLPNDRASQIDEPDSGPTPTNAKEEATTSNGIDIPGETVSSVHGSPAATNRDASFPGPEEDLSTVPQGSGTAVDRIGLEHSLSPVAVDGQTSSYRATLEAAGDIPLSPTDDQKRSSDEVGPSSAADGATSEQVVLPENCLRPGAEDIQDADGTVPSDSHRSEITATMDDLSDPAQGGDHSSPSDLLVQTPLSSGDLGQVMLASGQNVDEVIEAILKREHLQYRVSLDLIDFYPKNRQVIKQEALQEMAASIASVGVINDILLRPLPNGRYEVVAGEQRTRASRIAGQLDIPAKIYELTDSEARQIRVSENLHREDYHPMEEALAIGEMKEDYPKIDQIARRLGKPVNYVLGRIKLLSLIPEAQEILLSDAIGVRDAQELAAFGDDVQQTFVARQLAGWQKGKKFTDLRWAFDKLKFSLKNPPFNMKDPTLVPEMGICAKCEFNSGCQQALFADLAEDPVCRKAACYQAKTDRQLVKNVAEAVQKHKPMAIVTANTLSDEQYTLIKDIPGTEGLEVVLESLIFEVKKPQPPKQDKFKDTKGKLDKKAFDEADLHYKEAVAYQDGAIRNRKIFRSIRIQKEGTVDFFMFTRDSKAGPTGQSGRVPLIQEDIKAGTVTIKQLLDELTRIRENEKSAAKKDAAELATRLHAAVEVSLEPKDAKVTHHPIDNTIVRWMLYEKLHYQRELGERFFGEGWLKLSPEDMSLGLQKLTDDETVLLSRKVFLQMSETKQANSAGAYFLSQLAGATGIDLAALRQESDQKAEERRKKFKKAETELQRKLKQKQKKLTSKPAKTTSEQDQ